MRLSPNLNRARHSRTCASCCKGGAPAPSPANAPAPSPAKGGAPAPAPAGAAPAPSPGNGRDFPAPPPGKPPGPSPKEIDKAPIGKIADDGKGSDVMPSDAAAASDTRGAKAVQPTAVGIKAAGEFFFGAVELTQKALSATPDAHPPPQTLFIHAGDTQKDVSGKNLLVGTPIDVPSAKSQSGAKTTSAVTFTSDLNSAANGLPKPELTNAPAYGGRVGSSGGTYGITWLNANVYTISESGGWLDSRATIVLDHWEARVNSWSGFDPIFRAPAVGYTFTWTAWEYLWVRGERGVEAVWKRCGGTMAARAD